MSTVAVMGSGSWGTAMALTLSDNDHRVTIRARRAEVCDKINNDHRNPDYFTDLELPPSLRAERDPQIAMQDAEFVVLAVPSQSLRETLSQWQISDQAVIVSLAKGIELGSGLRMSQVIMEVTGAGPERIAVLTGPNLSHEIARRQPAAAVVASVREETAIAVQQLFHTATFRPYTNTDVIGCELGGATKNVIALAVGMAAGMGYGANATASLITRGLAEIIRLGEAMGADPHTFSGLAGIGDLVATCSSPLSRNRTFGEELGRGRTVAEIAGSTRQVAEGVKSCFSIKALAEKHHVEMPITYAVCAVIEGSLDPRSLVQALLARAPKPERY
ncbi:glycerol-3-phosphate dehydrogenase [NAD(P)+] [Microlunatus endophyticus]|uniref:Glycerol-3-phosphate dehydrogenase [NAD(P)+] n=1 Tax=Microlunatus endophyticus TaxID=1716077 RepID=A0A917S1H5_9ACTN|nr:NAD(P)H-dependent glycerol-3-phosphate dehydrogenase [Microlunatus endophyticus]GGL50218.1 glycerol-3-phosphate dehydrogenase [NAD(P)+] [Microlunatus endophyticus]